MLAVFDSSLTSGAAVLVLLIAARAVDAAAGPLGEALLVGRRTWVDVVFVVAGMALAAVGTCSGAPRSATRRSASARRPGSLRPTCSA